VNETTSHKKAKIWCVRELHNLEVLHATGITAASARHTHETLTLGVILQGTSVLEHKGETHLSPSSSLVVINPDDVHACHAASLTGYSQRIMYPSVALLQQATYEITGQKNLMPSFVTPVIQDEHLTQLVYKLHTTLETSSCPLERESQFLWTLTHLIQHHAKIGSGRQRKVGQERQAVSLVKEYLEAHYFDKISLKQLADITNLTPFHLARVFCREVGLPPHIYLIQIRVSRAKKLLTQGWAIASVAQETGFCHQSHLNRHFKRFVGVTPRQYQQISKNVQD